jgi:hypothetical protein
VVVPIPRFTSLDWQNADDSTVSAVIFEAHTASDLGIDRIVFSEASVATWTEPAPPLSHDDRAARDEIAIMRFDPESLRVRVAPVP